MLPQAVLGNVAGAAELDRNGGAAKTGHRHGDAITVDSGGVYIAVYALALPDFLTSFWIVAFQVTCVFIGCVLRLLEVSEKQLILHIDLGYYRRTPGPVCF